MKKVSKNASGLLGSCRLDRTLKIIGGKWKLIILWYVSQSTLRFSEIESKIPKITQKMLAQSLKELENDGLIIRKSFAVIPPRVEYSISDKGISLGAVLKDLDKWSSENIKE